MHKRQLISKFILFVGDKIIYEIHEKSNCEVQLIMKLEVVPISLRVIK